MPILELICDFIRHNTGQPQFYFVSTFVEIVTPEFFWIFFALSKQCEIIIEIHNDLARFINFTHILEILRFLHVGHVIGL